METTTSTGWAAYYEAKARFTATIKEQEANRYPTGTVEFTALVERYLTATAEMNAALSEAHQLA